MVASSPGELDLDTRAIRTRRHGVRSAEDQGSLRKTLVGYLYGSTHCYEKLGLTHLKLGPDYEDFAG